MVSFRVARNYPNDSIMCSDMLTDVYLPECITKELEASCNFRTETIEKVILKTTIGVKSFGPATIFAERGPFSGHVYQPKVNHREVDFLSYSHRQDTSLLSKPLCESMLFPKSETSFSVGNKMGLYCYEVTKPKDHS